MVVVARPRRLPVLLFAGWTLFVWGQRIVNVLGDDDLSGAGRAWRLGLAGTMVVLAVLVVVAVLSRGRLSASGPGFVRTLVVVTVGVWAWRAVDIVLGDWSIGFVVVHLVLAALSIGLAVWAWRATAASAPKPSIRTH